MNTNLHFAGISGSLRKGSFNTMLLNEVVKLLPEGVALDILSIAEIPFYNADLDVPSVKERPEPVKRFRDSLAKIDALLIVSPEYNYSIPGGLKNAIDWASRGEDSPMLKKPVALMGATPGMWGTVRMQTAFHPIFLFLEMKPVYKPEILLSQANNKFDVQGNLTDDKTKDMIRKKMHALKDLVLQMKK